MGTLSSSYPNSDAVENALNRANQAELSITEINSDLSLINERLDALEYQEIQIESFTVSPNLCELGSLNTVELEWSLNKIPLSQNINGYEVEGTSKQFSNVASDMTYVLNVFDGKSMASKNVSVNFANQIYYGVAANLNNVASLSKILSNEKTRTISVHAGQGKYIVYAVPARLGNVAFSVNGFEGGFESPVTQLLTNGSGYHEDYLVYRSTNANLGNTTVQIKEV